MSKLVVLRHGQTEYNVKKLMTGQRDVDLTEEGKKQAVEAGKRSAHIKFDKAYASILVRANMTAQLLLEASGSNDHLNLEGECWDIELRCEIIEKDAGDFSGRCHKTDPEIINHPKTYDVPLPNGESNKDVVERVQKFFDEALLPRLKAGENVLVVCHAGVVRAFDVVLGDVEPGQSLKTSIPNATPVVHEYDENGVKVKRYALDGTSKPKTPANTNTPPSRPKFKHG